jgi:hypothetical protein
MVAIRAAAMKIEVVPTATANDFRSAAVGPGGIRMSVMPSEFVARSGWPTCLAQAS